MTTLESLQAALQARGVRTYLADDGLNVWASPTDRYATTTVYFHESRATGNGFVWGARYEYTAPAIGNAEFIAATIEETLR